MRHSQHNLICRLQSLMDVRYCFSFNTCLSCRMYSGVLLLTHIFIFANVSFIYLPKIMPNVTSSFPKITHLCPARLQYEFISEETQYKHGNMPNTRPFPGIHQNTWKSALISRVRVCRKFSGSPNVNLLCLKKRTLIYIVLKELHLLHLSKYTRIFLILFFP